MLHSKRNITWRKAMEKQCSLTFAAPTPRGFPSIPRSVSYGIIHWARLPPGAGQISRSPAGAISYPVFCHFCGCWWEMYLFFFSFFIFFDSRYEKSYMHRDTVTHIVVSNPTEFIITGSHDGHVKFWKKAEDGCVEPVKHFRAHLEAVCAMALNTGGLLLGTTGADKAFKFFDVRAFDLISMTKLDFTPSGALAFVHAPSAPHPLVAIGDSATPNIHIINAENGVGTPLRTYSLHSQPCHCLRYNPTYHCVISADKSGKLEVWDPNTLKMPNKKDVEGNRKPIRFETKSETKLYELQMNKTYALTIAGIEKYEFQKNEKRIKTNVFWSDTLNSSLHFLHFLNFSFAEWWIVCLHCGWWKAARVSNGYL